MEPTPNRPQSGTTNSTRTPKTPTTSSAADATFTTTGAHATGEGVYPPDRPAQPADKTTTGGLQGTLNNAVAEGKKWLDESGVLDQAGQLPQKAKELGTRAWTNISGMSNTQKLVGIGLLTAGVAFLATRGGKRHKAEENDYRARPRRSPFEQKSYGAEGRGNANRPWGASRYGSPSGRVSSGSGYSSQYGADHGSRSSSSDRNPNGGNRSYGSGSYGSQGGSARRDQGPASGSRYNVQESGHQNPNNIDDLNNSLR